jgi:hypothetical protein
MRTATYGLFQILAYGKGHYQGKMQPFSMKNPIQNRLALHFFCELRYNINPNKGSNPVNLSGYKSLSILRRMQ